MTRSLPKGNLKVGRPRNVVPLVMVNFRADPQTLQAIERLAAAAAESAGAVNSARSFVIRKALIEAAAKLDSEVTTP